MTPNNPNTNPNPNPNFINIVVADLNFDQKIYQQNYIFFLKSAFSDYIEVL